jgi:hypothetical protein
MQSDFTLIFPEYSFFCAYIAPKTTNFGFLYSALNARKVFYTPPATLFFTKLNIILFALSAKQ